MDDEDAHTSETTPERAAEFAVNYLRDMRSWTKPTIVFDSAVRVSWSFWTLFLPMSISVPSGAMKW